MELIGKAKDRAPLIRLLAVDCDGVLTDGRLYFGVGGEALKVFDVHDGQGIVSWLASGRIFAIVTARSSSILTARAEELGIKHLVQKASDKADSVLGICKAEGIEMSEAAFVGDDLADVAAMEAVGLPIAVADAMPEARDAAIAVTSKNGGCGAVREVTDALLLAAA